MSLPQAQPEDVPVISPVEETPETTPDAPATEPIEAAPAPRRSFARRVLRAFTMLMVVAALVAAVIVGWPIVDDRVIQPIAANSTSVDALRSELDAATADIAALQVDVAAITAAEAGLPERLAGIEERLEQLAAADAVVAEALAELTAGVGTLDGTVAGHTERLAAIDALQAAAADQLATADATLTAQVGVLRAMELMSRGRLFLYQANYGLAEQDLAAARTVLAGLVDNPSVPAAVEGAVQRLDLALAALPDRPVLASDDLDIAWALLLDDGSAPAVEEPPAPTGDGDTETTTP